MGIMPKKKENKRRRQADRKRGDCLNREEKSLTLQLVLGGKGKKSQPGVEERQGRNRGQHQHYLKDKIVVTGRYKDGN